MLGVGTDIAQVVTDKGKGELFGVEPADLTDFLNGSHVVQIAPSPYTVSVG